MKRCVLVPALLLFLCLPCAPAAARRSSFSGRCRIVGPITPSPPITVLPRPNPHFDYRGAGTCSGRLDGKRVAADPAGITFVNTATSFDTCELGPDFHLHGQLFIGRRRRSGRGRRPSRFEIVANLARLAVIGPLTIATAGGGRGFGVGQFAPASGQQPQQCVAGGIGAATLRASFSTTSPLIGTRR